MEGQRASATSATSGASDGASRPADTAQPMRDSPAWRSRGAWATLLIALLAALTVDLASKRLAFATIAGEPVRISRAEVLARPPGRIGSLIPEHEPVLVAPFALELQLVLNPGAVFGVGPGKRWFFVGFTAVAIAFALWVFATWTRAGDWLAHAALGLIIAGGLGNLYDRLVFGCVRDFLHPLPGVHLPFGWQWPSGSSELWPWVSNVADALLLVGIAVLLARLWRASAPPPPQRTQPAPSATSAHK